MTDMGARPVEDRNGLVPLVAQGHHTIAVSSVELASILRRRRGTLHPDEWRTGGSDGTEGRTLYQGDRLQGLLLHADTAAWLAVLANAEQARLDQAARDRQAHRL